jgi:hypothetical protein
MLTFVIALTSVVAQTEYKLTIHANLLQNRPKKAKALEHFKRVWTQKIPIASISITNKGSLKFTLNIQADLTPSDISIFRY